MAVGFSLGGNVQPMTGAQATGNSNDLFGAIQKGLEGSQRAAQTVMKPHQLSADLLKTMLANKHQETINQYAPRSEEARIGLQEGNIGLLPLRQKLLEAQANKANRITDPYTTHLPGGGVGASMWLEHLRQTEGEDSKAYKDAKRLNDIEYNQIQSRANRNEALSANQEKRDASQLGKMEIETSKAQHGEYPNGAPIESAEKQEEVLSHFDAKTGALKAGEHFIYDPKTKEKVGIKRPLSEAERKEVKGRAMFERIQPIVANGLGEYSGTGSETRFTNDATKYGKDKAATKRIDDFLLAQGLLTSDIIKEDATLGGANTNQVYNRLTKSLSSQDLRPIVEKIAKGYILPKEAFIKAGIALPKAIGSFTKQAIQNVPANREEMFRPNKQEMVRVKDNHTGKYIQISREEYERDQEE